MTRRGQTLIEAMIALSILTVGFLGILTLLAQSLALNHTTAQETTATYLASEGIEISKNLVDHDVYEYLAGVPGYGWGACFGVGGSFQLDYTTKTCPLTPYNPSTHLNFNTTTHMYSYAGGVGTIETPYARLIRVTVPNANEIVVDSIVTWSSGGGGTQTIDLEDAFYNWHP
jgi:hypothetical protein